MRRLLAALALVAGCQEEPASTAATARAPAKKKTACEQLFDHHETCRVALADERGKFVAECEVGKKTALTKDYLACDGAGSCEDFAVCVGEVRGRIAEREREKRLKAELASLQKLVDDRGYTDAMKLCAAAAGPAIEALKPLCDRAAAEGFKTLEEALTGQRDQGDTKDLLMRCLDFKEFAKRVGEAELKRAELLCREVQVAGKVNQALAEAGDALQVKSSRIPPECEWARADLAKLGSVWAKSRAADVDKACFADLTVSAIATLMTELTALRDQGSAENATMKCADVRRLTASGPAEAAAKADTLCKEVEAAAVAKAAEDEVRRLIAAGKDNAPFECDQAAKRLGEIGTDFAKARAAALAQVCWIELGRVVFPKKVPGMKGICDFPVQKIYEAIKRLDLHDAALDPWIVKAAPLCEHK